MHNAPVEPEPRSSAGAAESEATQRDIERQLLSITAELVNELGGTLVTARLESSLERDLGISSLERVELLLRLEQAFHIRLPDAVRAEAVTLSDLVSAVLRAEPRVAEPLPSRREPPSPGTAAPSSAVTLVDVLYWHAERHRTGYTSIFARTTQRQLSGTVSC